jgi:hypothetical protein
MVIPIFLNFQRNQTAELMEHSMPEEVDQVDPRGASGEPTPSFQWQFANKDTLVVNADVLTIDSSFGFLRAAAE